MESFDLSHIQIEPVESSYDPMDQLGDGKEVWFMFKGTGETIDGMPLVHVVEITDFVNDDFGELFD